MPLYGYVCSACNHQFEQLQKINSPSPSQCPVCAGAVKRELGAPAFRLAGKGWYETDFKKSGETQRNLAEGTPSARARGRKP